MRTYTVTIAYPPAFKYEVEATGPTEAAGKAWNIFNENYDCYPDEYEPTLKSVREEVK